MVVTMIAVGMVQVTLDEIIYMVAEVIRGLDTLRAAKALHIHQKCGRNDFCFS
jgi:hypothetical protein